MSVTFTWYNSQQVRGLKEEMPWKFGERTEYEFMPRRLKSGLTMITYEIDGKKRDLVIELVREDENALEKASLSLSSDLYDICKGRPIGFKRTHDDTVQFIVSDASQDEVKSILSYLVEQAWLNHTVQIDMQRDFERYRGTSSDYKGPSR